MHTRAKRKCHDRDCVRCGNMRKYGQGILCRPLACFVSVDGKRDSSKMKWGQNQFPSNEGLNTNGICDSDHIMAVIWYGLDLSDFCSFRRYIWRGTCTNQWEKPPEASGQVSLLSGGFCIHLNGKTRSDPSEYFS